MAKPIYYTIYIYINISDFWLKKYINFGGKYIKEIDHAQ